MTIMTDTKEQQKRSQNHYWEIAAFNSYSGRIIYDYFFLVFFLAHDDEKKYSWLRRFTTFPFLISLLLLPTYPQLTGTRMEKMMMDIPLCERDRLALAIIRHGTALH